MCRIVAGQCPREGSAAAQALDHQPGFDAHDEDLTVERLVPGVVEGDQVAVVDGGLHGVADGLDADEAVVAQEWTDRMGSLEEAQRRLPELLALLNGERFVEHLASPWPATSAHRHAGA